MTRWWTDLLAAIDEVVPLYLVVLALVVLAAVVAVLWFFFPRWVPRRWPRFRPRRPRLRWPGLRWPRLRWPRLRWAWRRNRKQTGDEPDEPLADEVGTTDQLPDLSAAAFVSLADRLAADGRYAEAVRERLRAIVRDLIDRDVIAHHPGWTVTELAAAAASVRPAVDPPLGAAARLFSDIWYGQRPATVDDDRRMRGHAAEVTTALTERINA